MRPRTVNPFLPVRPRISKILPGKIQKLLRSPPVQEIHFALGSVVIQPQAFREIARRFDTSSNLNHNGLSGLRVVINRPFLDKEDANAMYISEHDAFYFRREDVVETDPGTVVHESVHAVCDYRGRSTAIRSEEGAAFVAEAWYHLARGVQVAAGFGVPKAVWETAQDLRSRSGNGMVRMSASQINTVRREMGRLEDPYENGHYTDHNGVSRPA